MSSRLAESRETVSYIFFGVNNYIFHIFILKYYCYPHYYPQESISFVLAVAAVRQTGGEQ